MTIYHITTKEIWDKASQESSYTPASFEKEGFIHCSTKEQVIPAANRRYHGIANLIVLVIDTEKVPSKIVFEDTSGRGEEHPHIYGPLPSAAVERIVNLTTDRIGLFQELAET